VTRDEDRRRLAFDEDAALYDRARPGYPDALFDDIVALALLPPDGRVLEIGCGTGQATGAFARRGYHVRCVELGANLAALARRNLAAYPKVEIVVGAFESVPLEDGMYDLVAAASAFHWIDPAIRNRKAARILNSRGSIALFRNTHVATEASADFFQAVQEVYRRDAPSLAAAFRGLSHPAAAPTPGQAEIGATGLFEEAAVRTYAWESNYDSTQYVALLDTYSDHRGLDAETRERLLHGIGELIERRFGGRIVKEYLAILYLARRRG